MSTYSENKNILMIFNGPRFYNSFQFQHSILARKERSKNKNLKANLLRQNEKNK